MSRLIDADVLSEYIQEEVKQDRPDDFKIKNIQRFIKDMPIAYDVEKVVAELEHFAKLAEDRWVNGTSNHAYQEHKCWVKAIDIVRKGGIE